MLSALFERLHARDGEAASREDALCRALIDAHVPIPPAARHFAADQLAPADERMPAATPRT